MSSVEVVVYKMIGNEFRISQYEMATQIIEKTNKNKFDASLPLTNC